MAITNHLNVSFNYKEIDNKYDFYIISTTDKYISNGSYVIDKVRDNALDFTLSRTNRNWKRNRRI